MLGAMVMFRQAHRSKDYDAFFEYFSTMSATTDLQLDWLRAFVTVVDAGSLTAAAPKIHRSQSALSMQLRKLEEAIGRPVLTRGPRHLALTPAGAELLGYARRLLAVHGEAVAALRANALTGTVSLGVPDDYALAYLTPVLRTFAARHAGVEITLVGDQSTVLIPKVQRGELDLAVVTRDRAQRGRLLFREPLAWVGAPQYEVWLRDPLPIAVYEAGSRAREAALAALGAERRAYRVVCSSPSIAGHLAAAQSGMAVAVLTRCSVPPGLLVLDARHGLPALPDMEVALIRSRAAAGSAAADAMQAEVMQTLARV